jgi:hypothetical protein
MMTQVFVAAWIGVTVGWIGFGWALEEAPGEMRMATVSQQQELNVASNVAYDKDA